MDLQDQRPSGFTATALERAAIPPVFFDTETRRGFVNPYGAEGAGVHVLLTLME